MRILIGLILTLSTMTGFAQVKAYQSTTLSQVGGGGTAYNVGRQRSFGMNIVITATVPTAGTFTCAVSDICTKTAHGFATGVKVQFTTTTTLPAGLSLATDYFLIRLSADTFSVATSLANAQAGTPIVDITSTGTGTHTVTATAIAGASVKLQGSMDNLNWDDLPIKATGDASKSDNITAAGTIHLNETDLNTAWVRAFYTMTAGQVIGTEQTLVH